MDAASFVVAILSLLCSAIAISYTRRSSTRSRQEAELTLLHQLQSEYDAIRSRMDIRYRLDDWRPDRGKPAEWMPLEEYWFFCYREWRLTKGDKSGRFGHIWEDHIENGIKAGLSHPPLRFVLATIRAQGSLQDVYAEEFIQELIRLNVADFHDEFGSEIKAQTDSV